MSPHSSGRHRPQPRLNQEHPSSFSAALLDAIYHSLDAEAPRRAPASPAARTAPLPSGSGRRHPPPSLSPPVSSARSPRLQKPPRPCRVRPDPQPFVVTPPPPPESAGDSVEKRRSRRRLTKSAPFSCLLNALLCNRRRSAEPTPALAMALPAVTAEPPSARSILSSSRASPRDSARFLARGRRAVRFSPVEAAVDEEGSQDAGAARPRDAESTEVAGAADTERRVEELLRALGVAEEKEKERAKESSDSSSDLFELEILSAFDEAAEMPGARAAGGDVGLARPRPRVL